MAKERFSADEAREIGERLGIEWTKSLFDLEQFRLAGTRPLQAH